MFYDTFLHRLRYIWPELIQSFSYAFLWLAWTNWHQQYTKPHPNRHTEIKYLFTKVLKNPCIDVMFSTVKKQDKNFGVYNKEILLLGVAYVF